LQDRPNDQPTARTRPGVATLAAVLGLVALIGWRYGPILLTLETHFADFAALHADQLLTEGADSRLNAWILDWVQRTAFEAPATILDTNAFYPASRTLTGSEHLFGVALQTFPLRGLVDGAIGIHQLALILSALGLAAASFLGVRSLTGSNTAGFVAGAAAVMMPWRTTEISHLQLSSVQWFPAIWILLLRAVYREVGMGERVLLAVGVALQLLSSFYLAYFLTLSSGLLLLLTAFGDAARRRRLPPILMSLLPGYLAFGASALPYLSARAATDLAPSYDPLFSVGLGRVWELLHPQVPTWLQSPPPTTLAPDPAYDIPAGVLLLALGAGAAAVRRDFFTRELRAAVWAFWAIAGLGLVLMFGGSVELGTVEIPLPTQLMVAVLPGFEMLRGPVRWSILIGVALPLLAGVGIAALQRIPSFAARNAAVILAVIGVAASVDPYSIPARAAWPAAEATAQRYAALAALPHGPVVEVPFSRPFANADLGARALLASTLHRQPTVNGYTGYAPRSHYLLRRLGQRLPQREAILQFGRLTGARYFVVQLNETTPVQRAAWKRWEAEGLLQRRFSDNLGRIYELRASAANGSGISGMVASKPGPTTATGLPRAPLSLEPGAGSLEARIPPYQRAGIENPVQVAVRNTSPWIWPSLDVYREGLVLLRYSWWQEEDTAPLQTGLTALDHDVSSGQAFAGTLALAAPLREGAFTLCLDLVQQSDGHLKPLPIPAVTRPVQLTRPPGLKELAELIAAATPAPKALAPCQPAPAPAE